MTTFVGDDLTAGTALARGPDSAVVLRSPRYVFTLSGALADSDVIELAPVLPGQTVYDVILEVTDLDTDGSPTMTLDVGDGDDPDRYVDGTTIAATGGITGKNTLTAPRTYTTGDTIDVTVLTVATSATSGTVSLTLLYTDPYDRRAGVL